MLQNTADDPINAIKTWRYLRLAMIAVVVGLFAAILIEHGKTNPSCWQTSISAYYYTPVQGFFVGALATIGACLIALRGNTDVEDILLNAAGMFAPVVAFVPTPSPGTCGSVLGTTKDRDANVANNVGALLIVGIVGLVLLLALMIRAQRADDPAVHPTRLNWIGYGIALGLWLVAWLLFTYQRHFFTANAHYTSAVLMFACILAVVAIDAWQFHHGHPTLGWSRNPYLWIAGAMAASVVSRFSCSL